LDRQLAELFWAGLWDRFLAGTSKKQWLVISG
jgi:hypothetical protein